MIACLRHHQIEDYSPSAVTVTMYCVLFMMCWCHLNSWTPVSDMSRMRSTSATRRPPSIIVMSVQPPLSSFVCSVHYHFQLREVIVLPSEWPQLTELLRRHAAPAVTGCPGCCVGEDEVMLYEVTQHSRVTTIFCDLGKQTWCRRIGYWWKGDK